MKQKRHEGGTLKPGLHDTAHHKLRPTWVVNARLSAPVQYSLNFVNDSPRARKSGAAARAPRSGTPLWSLCSNGWGLVDSTDDFISRGKLPGRKGSWLPGLLVRGDEHVRGGNFFAMRRTIALCAITFSLLSNRGDGIFTAFLC